MSKKTKNTYSKGRTITPEGRVSFPHLAEPHTGGEYPSDKYELTLLFPKEGTDLTGIKNLLTEPLKERWPELTLKDVLHPVRDGDAKYAESQDDEDREKREHLRGHWFIKAKSGDKPGCVDADGMKMDPNEIYGGCWARMSVSSGTYVLNGQKGVTLFLGNVQFIRDDEAFGGGRVSAESEFGAVVSNGSAGEAQEDIPF